MTLELKYREQFTGQAAAALIPGRDAAVWLTEINNWGISPATLRCFVLPESIRDRQASGLLVIFKGPVPAELRYSYQQVSEGFFIPCQACLFPEVTTTELAALKAWPVQVFHPAIGLVGYELSDELNLTELISWPMELPSAWRTGFPPPVVYPRLQSIRLEAEAEALDTVAALQALIAQKPLDEIPEAEEAGGKLKKYSNKVLRLLSTVGLWLLLILAFIGKLIFGILQAFFGGKQPSYQPQRQGWLQQLENWVNSRLKDLAKQRDSELNRLVKLFDKNKDEALNYAIPLNSPYLNRGTAAPSGKLTRRSTNMGFGGFGGGRADFWDLGEYRAVLRQRYLDTAAQAIAAGDYKKAAYVHAHLLGDLFTAAQILKDGKHYREAAVLYKDHLNNKARAAECLESGGLLGEAIPIYVELQQYEKVGDLYTQLGQEGRARDYYSDTVRQLLEARDYLNACRLTIDKMKDREAGREILLTGWKDNRQPEVCLTRYFDSVADPETELIPTVKAVYSNHVSLRKSTAFLEVLADLSARPGNESLRTEALGITYQVVQRQTARGDHSALRLLPKFLPDDRLVGHDTNRFMLRNPGIRQATQALSFIKLNADYRWLALVNYHDQLIGVGLLAGSILILRANWEGRTTYELLFNFKGEAPALQLVADAQVSSQLLLIGNEMPFQTQKWFEVFRDYDRAFSWNQLNWRLPGTIAIGQQSDHAEVSILQSDGEELRLDLFSLEGSLLQKRVVIYNGEPVKASDSPAFNNQAMYWRKEYFYLTGKDFLARIDESGMMEILPLPNYLIGWSLSNPHAALRIALLCDKGCLIITPGLKEMLITTSTFGQDVGASFVQLLNDNRLVLATDSLALVYDISRPEPKLIYEIQPENTIYKILTVPKRHHFALLESDNRISIHRLPEDGAD